MRVIHTVCPVVLLLGRVVHLRLICEIGKSLQLMTSLASFLRLRCLLPQVLLLNPLTAAQISHLMSIPINLAISPPI